MVEQSTEGLLQSIADKITKLTEVDTSPQKQLIQRDVVLFFSFDSYFFSFIYFLW